jgi:hypothetical protein
MITEIRNNKETLAIIAPHGFSQPGIHFITPNEYSKQSACIRHLAGKIRKNAILSRSTSSFTMTWNPKTTPDNGDLFSGAALAR